MRKYELTVVLKTKTTPVKKKAISANISKIISALKGKAADGIDWGEKEAGIYLHFPLELDAKSAESLSLKLKGESDVLKYLLIKNG